MLTYSSVSFSQTTNVTVTIYLPNVSVTYRPIWSVYPYFENNTLYVRVTCLTLGGCPPLTISVTNGTVSYTRSVNISCSTPPCSTTVSFANITGAVTVTASYDGVTKTFVVYAPKLTGAGRDILTIAFVLGTIALALRGDKRYAAVGLIAGAIVIAAAAMLGFLDYRAYIVAVLSIIAGVVLWWA